MSVRLEIRGIQEVQAANNRMMAAFKPRGALEKAIHGATMRAHRYAVAITHVDTGALRASHRMRMERRGMRGVVYIDPGSVNPRSSVRPYRYGVYEHDRGGDHAFYERTVEEEGPRIADEAVRSLVRSLGR